MTLPWTLAASIAVGAFLMLTRLTFGTEGAMANSDHLMGALTITVAIIATAEVARALRFVNIGFGVWLIVATLILEGASVVATIACVLLGLVLIAISLTRGRLSGVHYAGDWKMIHLTLCNHVNLS